MRGIDPTTNAQIAFFLARFVSNVRSLPLDPIVARANLTDALGYVRDYGIRTLSEYARHTDSIAKAGLQVVAVDVVSVVRASPGSFEIRWKEETHDSGKIVRAERFTGVAEVGFKRPTDALRNPLGLYVNAFNWSRD